MAQVSVPLLPEHPTTLYVFVSILSWEICGLKEAINVWHELRLVALLHISCLSVANSPWVMMKRFNWAEGKREIHKERQKGRDLRGCVFGGGALGGKMKGQTQISPASVWQRMWEMNCLIGTFVSIKTRSSVSALTEGFPGGAPHQGFLSVISLPRPPPWRSPAPAPAQQWGPLIYLSTLSRASRSFGRHLLMIRWWEMRRLWGN